MITLRVNVVALIVAGMVGTMIYLTLRNAYSNAEMAIIAILTTVVLRVYDGMASLPAFKEKKNEKKGEKKETK